MKKYILPIIAAVLIIVAVVVVTVVPKDKNEEKVVTSNEISTTKNEEVEKEVNSGVQYANFNEDGDVVIDASELSEDTISFIRFSEDSKIELIAIKGADGTAKVALGTCQSCNGSPGAFYSQNGEELQCNNCGLTFPLSVIGEDGSGCHPMMLDDAEIKETDTGVVVSSAALLAREGLFVSVAEH